MTSTGMTGGGTTDGTTVTIAIDGTETGTEKQQQTTCTGVIKLVY
jgi:hypothetical protein